METRAVDGNAWLGFGKTTTTTPQKPKPGMTIAEREPRLEKKRKKRKKEKKKKRKKKPRCKVFRCQEYKSLAAFGNWAGLDHVTVSGLDSATRQDLEVTLIDSRLSSREKSLDLATASQPSAREKKNKNKTRVARKGQPPASHVHAIDRHEVSRAQTG